MYTVQILWYSADLSRRKTTNSSVYCPCEIVPQNSLDVVHIIIIIIIIIINVVLY